MRLATIKLDGVEQGGIIIERGLLPIKAVNAKYAMDWKTSIFELIETGQLENMNEWYRNGGKEKLIKLNETSIPINRVEFCPLYRRPNRIFGIGLNYAEHASDLAEKTPNTEPASFFKPFTTIIGHGDNIEIPLKSVKTTAEAELGIILGKECKNVKREDWLNVVVGFTTIIDMTAEDILRKNPRYLTLSKSFDTFFSFGPQLVTSDEVEDVLSLNVATVINGKVHAENVVSNMAFPPDYLISFHSEVMGWLPGDILSTGTPRAIHINQGDVVECRIDGFETLINPVVDKK